MTTKAWMVRSGGDGFLIDEFMDQEVVSIGWNELGPISLDISYQDLKILFAQKYPESGNGYVAQSCGQIWRFIYEIQNGDWVFTYDPQTRLYYVGEIISPYIYNEGLSYRHSRKVKWRDFPAERDSFSVDAKNTLGSVLTVFSIPDFIIAELDAYILKGADETEIDEAFEHFRELERLDFLKAD